MNSVTVSSGINSIAIEGAVQLDSSLEGCGSAITGLAWHPDGSRLVAVTDDGWLWLWDLVDSHPPFSKQIAKHLTDVSWSGDGRELACSTAEGTVITFDPWRLRLKHVKVLSRSPLIRIAWGPSTEWLAAGGADRRLYVVEPRDSVDEWRVQKCLGHCSSINSVAWAHDASMLLSGTEDGVVGVWRDSRVDNQLRHFLAELEPGGRSGPWSHDSPVIDIILSHKSDSIASLSEDGEIKFWSASETNQLASVDTGELGRRLGFSPDGRLAVARTLRKVRFLDCEQGKEICSFSYHSRPGCGVMAVNGLQRRLALDNLTTKRIDIYRIDFSYLLNISRVCKQRYKCAKVVVLGGCGVGKSSLARALAGEKGNLPPGPHNLAISRLHREEIIDNITGSSEVRELMIWDFANSSDGETLHRLQQSEPATTLMLFDWQLAVSEPLEKDHVLRGLKLPAGRSRASAVVHLLVGTRSDRVRHAPDMEVRTRLHQYLNSEKIYITSAQTSEGIRSLHGAICDSIDWETIPALEQAHLLEQFGRYFAQKISNGLVVETEDGLYSSFIALNPSLVPIASPSDFAKGVDILAKQGLIHRFPFGKLLLLSTLYLETYANALARAARHDEHGLGRVLIEERSFVTRLDIDESQRIQDPDQEALFIQGLVSELVKRSIAFRVTTNAAMYLVFPQECTRNPLSPPEKDRQSAWASFEGDTTAIFASLLTRLLDLRAFYCKPEIYPNAVTFEANSGGLCGIVTNPSKEAGAGEISVYFEGDAGDFTRQAFQKVVADHLDAYADKYEWTLSDSPSSKDDVQAIAGKAFFCYEPEDFTEVDKIACDLKARNINPWLAGVRMAPGDEKSRVRMEMETHSVAIFPVRSSSLSRSMQRDLAFFKSRKCRIIPVILPRASSRFKLPGSLKAYVPVDFRVLGREPFDQLARGITTASQESSLVVNSNARSQGVLGQGHVFLSYSHADRKKAAVLRDMLREGGHSVWWGEEIEKGEEWRAKIKAEIESAYAFVICFSTQSAEVPKSGVYPELATAIDIYMELRPQSVYLFPVLLSGCNLPSALIGGGKTLSHFQITNAYGHNRQAEVRKLLEALDRVRNQRGNATSA